MTSRMMVKWCGYLLLLFTVAFVTNAAEANWEQGIWIDEGGRAYSAQVLTEPNGNAIVQWLDQDGVLGAKQYDVDIGWGPFELLERTDVTPGIAEQFVFGIDMVGNIIAAWREWDGKRWWIHTSQFDAGGSWSAPEIIDTGDRGDSSSLTITMNPAGNAIMMWRETTKQGVYNYTRMYVPGAGWQESIQLPEDINTWYEPAISANGNAIFLYKTDDTNEIYAKPYEAGIGWGSDERIDMGTGTASGAVVGMDPSGNATVVWSENDGTQINTYARRFDVGTGWGTAQGYSQGYSYIGMDSSGNVVTVQNVVGAYGVEADKIYTNTYKVGVGWGTVELMWTASNLTGSNGIKSFEINSDGEAVLLWCRYENSTINIYANYYSPETGWDTPEMIGTELDTDESPGPSWTGRAVIDERGNVIAIWRWHQWDEYNPIDRIYSREYKPGEGWKPPVAVVTYYPIYRFGLYDIARQPVISMNPIGDAFLVWITPGMVAGMENMYRIYAARYVAERPPACEGDFDSNGEVDDVDLAVFAGDFGRSDCASGLACEGDFDTNNNVDGSDLATFAADLGRTDCP